MPSSPRVPPVWRATLRRSIRLFRAFLVEQSDPARFYGSLAQDAAAHIGHYARLDGAVVLDVGGGPGYFADAFEKVVRRIAVSTPTSGRCRWSRPPAMAA